MSDRRPSVAVVVPTRDRVESLRRCLRALEDQTLRPRQVIVVDDGSTRPEQVADAVAETRGGCLVRGAGAGPAAARNAGARAARASIVCFTDDDCEPAREWIERLTGPIRSGAPAAAGATVNARPQSPVAAASQAVTNFASRATLRASGRIGFAPTCNVAAGTEVLADVPFDERFPLAAGEDRDWCARLDERGLALAFEPAAVVTHHQRLSLRAFWRQQVAYGRGAYRFRRGRASRRRLEAPAFYLRLVRFGLRHGALSGLLVVLAQAATAWGFACEALAERRGTAP